ncbi:MAG TPA: mersacidin/lichenicidin family type 2 lantibiotic [Ktedonosporobacter sp.]|nr:mersacidin/lichenicidin family type 2 lantibiotic [Ktedonosporobacter sp.]
MSTEEIINAWKQEQSSGKKPGKTPGNPTGKPKPEKKEGKASINPAGEIELSDEELEEVEGGLPEFINSLNESCYEICENKE